MIARGYSKVNSASANPLSLVALQTELKLNLAGTEMASVGAKRLASRPAGAPGDGTEQGELMAEAAFRGALAVIGI